MNKEIFSQATTFEVKDDNGVKTLEGYAVKYGVETAKSRMDVSGKKYYHRFEAGSFDETLEQNKKVALIIGHNHEKVMASTENGTLTLESNDEGLRFSANLANVSYANDAYTLIERGDLSQMSFGIEPGEVKKFEDEDKNILSHTKVEKLYELSVVLYPAFAETSVVAMAEELEEAAKKLIEEEKPKTYDSKIYKIKAETLKLKKS